MKPPGILLALVAALGAWPAGAAAQGVQIDPLQCWWRTSSGAVRVGEPLTVILTCATLETDDVKVVVDESKLEPSVVQFAPFETLGGYHGADLRNGDRRFFQYEYRLRLIAENAFGKDVALPETKLTYRIQSRVGPRRNQAGAPSEAIAGRDQTYVLPPLSVRITSLVPADATDIRDSTQETFADIDQRSFRANLLVVIGGVLLALAGLMAVMSLVRLILRARRPATGTERIASDAAVLRAAGRELADVQRQREAGGWTADLAGRALAGLRIVGTYALGSHASRTLDGHFSVPAESGNLVMSAGWRKRKRILVSGSATPRTMLKAIAASNGNGAQPGELESIEQALSRFTAAQYGRNGALDDSALDESLAAGQRVLRRLKIEQLWPIRKFVRRKAPDTGQRVWSR